MDRHSLFIVIYCYLLLFIVIYLFIYYGGRRGLFSEGAAVSAISETAASLRSFKDTRSDRFPIDGIGLKWIRIDL